MTLQDQVPSAPHLTLLPCTALTLSTLDFVQTFIYIMLFYAPKTFSTLSPLQENIFLLLSYLTHFRSQLNCHFYSQPPISCIMVEEPPVTISTLCCDFMSHILEKNRIIAEYYITTYKTEYNMECQ